MTNVNTESWEWPRNKMIKKARIPTICHLVLLTSFLGSLSTHNYCVTEFSLEFCEDVGVGVIWEELTTSKLLSSTYLKIKGICSLKALKIKRLRYTGKNTGRICISIGCCYTGMMIVILICRQHQNNNSA